MSWRARDHGRLHLHAGHTRAHNRLGWLVTNIAWGLWHPMAIVAELWGVQDKGWVDSCRNGTGEWSPLETERGICGKHPRYHGFAQLQGELCTGNWRSQSKLGIFSPKLEVTVCGDDALWALPTGTEPRHFPATHPCTANRDPRTILGFYPRTGLESSFHPLKLQICCSMACTTHTHATFSLFLAAFKTKSTPQPHP